MDDVFSSGDQDVEDGFDAWAGASYRGPRLEIESHMASFNFRPFLFGRSIAFKTLEEWYQCSTRLEDYYHDKVRPAIVRAIAAKRASPYLCLYEDEAVRKNRVNWMAIGYGRQVFSGMFEARSSAQAAELRPWLRRKGLRYVSYLSRMSDAEIRQVIDESEVRVDKSKGAPFFQGGADYEAGLALALLGRKVRSKKELDELLGRISGGVPLYMQMLKRVQASGKDVPRRTVVNGRITASGRMFGPKIRTVKAPPFVHNNKVAWYFNLQKKVMIECFAPHHTLQPLAFTAVGSRFKYSFSSDMSTFDDTISVETLVAWREEIADRILGHLLVRGLITQADVSFFHDYDESVVNGHIICPARYKDEVACVLTMTGGVKSGERGTTIKDNDISFARAEALLASLAKDKATTFLGWGDDLVILTNERNLQHEWRRSTAHRHLFSEKVAPGAVFLMKMIPQGHGFIMRYAGRRLNHEAHEEPSSMVQCALSLKSTHEALYHPRFVREAHPAAALYLPMIAACIPRLRTAVELASSCTYQQLSDMYVETAGSVLGARRLTSNDIYEMEDKGAELDDATVAMLQKRAAVRGRILTKHGPIFGRYTEAELQRLADLYSMEEVVRACRK